MIGKLVRKMFTAQSLSALTVSVCLLIDNIMIGRHLGSDALAANSLASPILLILAATSSLLSTGAQVACSRSLGKGSQEETNVAYSTALTVSVVFSVVFAAVIILLRVPLARLMGAKTLLVSDTGDYMAGFAIGAPASMMALILIPFLQIAGQSGLLIAAVLSMTVADVALDLLNVFVFKGGMFGMGLASSLSYYIAVFIAGWYFLSKKCVFRFSFSRVKLSKLREFLAGGTPAMVGMVPSVLLVFIMNHILLGTGSNGKMLVAVYAIITTIGNASNCVSTGTAGVSLTLSGIFYNEEDRTGLRRFFSAIACTAAAAGMAVMILLLIFAPSIVRLFISRDTQTIDMNTAVMALRLFSIGLIPCCLNNMFRSCYQGTERVRLMDIISLTENLVLPVAVALVMRSVIGESGVWLYFCLGEFLALIGIVAYVCVRKRGIPRCADDYMLLRKNFGVPPEDLFEADARTVGDVMAASRSAEDFCRSHGGSSRLCAHIALCVEEMGTNIVTHGFAENKKNTLSVRLQYKDARWTLRFRDDCTAFDPVSHVSEKIGSESVGIRLAMRMADEARYTYSLNLNNLTLILQDPA